MPIPFARARKSNNDKSLVKLIVGGDHWYLRPDDARRLARELIAISIVASSKTRMRRKTP